MTGNDASDEPSGSVATDGDALNSPFDEFIRQSPDILWVHVDHDARVVDTNDAFRHELTVPDEGQSLFSILTPDAGEAVFLAHRLTGPGVPMVFHQVDGRPGYLFHVYWRSSGFFLFGVNQVLPESRVTELLSRLTTELGNMVQAERRANRSLTEAYARIEALSHTDGLTGLSNHLYLMERGADILRHGDRHQRPLSLVMMDLDHFKQVNDNFGHQAGDEVLATLGALLLRMTRAGDIAARYGGEEFVALLQDSNAAAAVQFAERMREVMELAFPLGKDYPVTMSLGVAEHREGETLEALVARADEAMYEAKRTGRNRVCLARTVST